MAIMAQVQEHALNPVRMEIGVPFLVLVMVFFFFFSKFPLLCDLHFKSNDK